MVPAQTVSVQNTQGNPSVIHVQQPTTVVYAQSSPPTSNVRDNYADKASLALGIIQCVFGLLAFILDIVGIVIRVIVRAGGGIWCGIIFTITGVLGIIAAKNKNVNTIIAFMVMSIIAAFISIIALLPIYSVSAVLDLIVYGDSTGHYGVDCTMIALALAECVVAIISSAICCAGTCCQSSPGQIHTATVHPVGQQQVIYHTQMTSGGQIVYTNPQMQPGVPPPYGQEAPPPIYNPTEPSTAPGVAYPPGGAYGGAYPQAGAQPQEYPQKM